MSERLRRILPGAIAPLLFLLAALPLLNRSLWHDELVTVRMFSGQTHGFDVVSVYPYPNNHLLNSLLIHWLLPLGSSEWLIRLPAVAGTVLLLVAFYFWMQLYFKPLPAAAMTVAILLVMPVFGYGIHARGYSLMMGFGTAAMALLDYYRQRRHLAAFAGAWLCLVLATYAILTAALLLGGAALAQLALWGVMREKKATPPKSRQASSRKGTSLPPPAPAVLPRLTPRRLAAEAGIMLGACIIVGLLYWPVLDQLRTVMKSQAFPYTPAALIAGLDHVLQAPVILGLALLVVPGVCEAQKRGREVWLLLGVTAATPLAFMGIMRMSGPPRSYLYLIPPVWAAICFSFAWYWRLLRKYLPAAATGAILVLAIGGWLGSGLYSFLRHPNTAMSGCPDEDWKEGVQEALGQAKPGQILQFRANTGSPVTSTCADYYLSHNSESTARLAKQNGVIPVLPANGEATILTGSFLNVWEPGQERVDPFAGLDRWVVTTPQPDRFNTLALATSNLRLPSLRHKSSLSLEEHVSHQRPLPRAVVVHRGDAPSRTATFTNSGDATQKVRLELPLEVVDGAEAVVVSIDAHYPRLQSVLFMGEDFPRWGSAADYLIGLAPDRKSPISVFTLQATASNLLLEDAPQVIVSTQPQRVRQWLILPYQANVRLIVELDLKPGHSFTLTDPVVGYY